jgi:hypothetical protein
VLAGTPVAAHNTLVMFISTELYAACREEAAATGCGGCL